MRVDNPISLIRTLKGAPLSILLILRITGQPVSASFLVAMSGYTDKPITSGLEFLKELGFVSKLDRYHWQITGQIQQLPLSLDDLSTRNYSESTPTTATATIVQYSDSRGDAEAAAPLTRNNSESSRIRSLLSQSGIGEPTASALAVLDHVTFDYVSAHIQQAAHDHISINLLIHRIRSCDPMPPPVDNDRQRYITGQFSHLVIH